jgi:hypothetical protein
MKSQLTVIISFLCLGIGLFTAWVGTQKLSQHTQDNSPVASEYNPPGRGGAYPGGTRMREQPNHRDYA